MVHDMSDIFVAAHRHIGETNMNLHSSRSHTIFRMVRLFDHLKYIAYRRLS